MADIELDTLPELTTIATDDQFAVFDTSTEILKRITRANALANVMYTNVANTVTAATTFDGAVILTRATATIAAGVVTAVGGAMVIDTEAAAATDDLDTLSGGATGQIMILQSANSARDVTVKHGTGNIYLTGRVDFTLTGTRDKLVLMCVSPEWHEIGRGDNSA
jgi:hypothetical protein